jgi:anti-anti-sigma factor
MYTAAVAREGATVVALEILAGSSRHFQLVGELDLSTVGAVEGTLLAACTTPGDLTLHLERLAFMDSSGLHLLVRIAKELDGTLHLAGVQAHTRKLLEVSGIDRHPKILVHDTAPDQETATEP